MTTQSLETRAINTLRFLSADAVQKANSGHPGLPMGGAAMAYTIWTRHLRHNPRNPKWIGRDRFILSGGHGSMLLYSLLHLTGYDLSLDEIKNFRQWESLTPGHPEYGLTPGVEVTTGPLGQGFANGVGMAIAASHLAATFNQSGHNIIDPFIYAIVTDGDLMEGVAAEAASMAGHMSLGRLIYLYDDNNISIDGSTDLAFTEDRAVRFRSYGWQVLRVEDGNDVEAIDKAIKEAKADPRPSLIMCKTIIGFGAPNRQGTQKAHGEPLGEDELSAAKTNLGWDKEAKFFIPEDVLAFYHQAIEKGRELEADWNMRFEAYKRIHPALGSELQRRLNGELPKGWDWEEVLPKFPADAKGMATRAASGKVINALASGLPELIGGSADLAPSNNTKIDGSPAFQKDSFAGRNFHFGVREHAMGSVLNGMAVFGGVIPYGGTFLVFADYMRPPIRLAALSHYPSIFIFTHDSVGLGEDGPTHQPIEHLMSLRLIPNLIVVRPADANETAGAWKVAIENKHAPTVLALTRQNVPTFETSNYAGVEKGAYILKDFGEPQMILMASGSEVSLIMEAAQKLADEGKGVRVVSFPSWELFEKQDEKYKDSVLPKSIQKRLAVEAGSGMGWERYAKSVISIERYGASAPYKTIFEHLGFTVENVVAKAKEL
ncbi:MAG TPA: transketolase [Anaerolineae bacterium]|nr:transketolase [Anaerolineae bacterium]